jgi:anti-sigma factor RsiW
MAWSWVTPRRGTDPPLTPRGVPLQAQVAVEGWRVEDTTVRSHSALGYVTGYAKAWTTHHPNAQIRWTNNRVSDHADAPVNHQAKRSLRRGRITPPRGRDVVSDRCAAERATMGRPAKP